MTRNHPKGFTLIEMIAVMGLVAILGGVVYSTFSQGARLWHHATASRPDLDLDIFLEKLVADLHNTFMDSADPFVGTKQGIRFFTIATGIEPGFERKFGSLPRPARVSYQYDVYRKQVIRIQEEYGDLLAENKKETTKILLENVENLKFEYYEGRDRYGMQRWKESWGEKYLPEGVKVKVKYDDHIRDSEVMQKVKIYNADSGS